MPSAKTSAGRILLYNLLALIVFAIVGGGILEAFCRTVLDDGMRFEFEMWRYARQLKMPQPDPELPFVHRPNGHARIMGADVVINGAGLRSDREIAVERDPSTTRIMMLGDSVTFGFGVGQDESTSAQLEKRLNAAGSRAEVLNAGVGNYNTSMEVAAYVKNGRRFHPDLVVLNFFVNDAEPTPVPQGNVLTRSSLAAVYFNNRMDAVARWSNGAPGWQQYYSDLFADNAPGWIKARTAIGTLKQTCDQDGTPLVIVNYPDLHQTSPYPLKAITARIESVARDLNVPFYDLTPIVEQDSAASLTWVNGGDPHPNAPTHAKYAQQIGEWLSASGLLAPKAATR